MREVHTFPNRKTMKPKEKAQEIFNKMYQVDDIMGNYPMCFDTAKKCALIAVEEIIECTKNGLGTTKFSKEYWQQVKYELQSFQITPNP